MTQISTLERAFLLAQAGTCHTVSDIRTQLKREQRDSVDAHLAGPSIQRQLRSLISSSRSEAAEKPA